jgi:hypothetical protein
MLFFGLERSIIGNRTLPDLITFVPFYDFSPPGPEPQQCLHLLNKGPTTHRDTVRPFILPSLLPRSSSIPPPTLCDCSSTGHTTRLQATLAASHDRSALSSRLLNRIVSEKKPHRRMRDRTRAYHVGINVDNAPPQMIPAFHRGGMIAIFPVGSLSLLSLIEFLPRSSSHQLH